MILSALNLPQDSYPVFASTLFFELWSNENDTDEIKLLYNGAELDLYQYCHGVVSKDGSKACGLELFNSRILEETVQDIKAACWVGPA